MNIYIATLQHTDQFRAGSVKVKDIKLFSSFRHAVEFTRQSNENLSNPHKHWIYEEVTVDKAVPSAHDVALIVEREDTTPYDAINALYVSNNYIEDAMAYIREKKNKRS